MGLVEGFRSERLVVVTCKILTLGMALSWADIVLNPVPTPHTLPHTTQHAITHNITRRRRTGKERQREDKRRQQRRCVVRVVYVVWRVCTRTCFHVFFLHVMAVVPLTVHNVSIFCFQAFFRC